MMAKDIQTCRVCRKQFDFNREGLASERDGRPFHVCGATCAKRAAKQAGNYHAIHDNTDAIVDHNVGS